MTKVNWLEWIEGDAKKRLELVKNLTIFDDGSMIPLMSAEMLNDFLVGLYESIKTYGFDEEK